MKVARTVLRRGGGSNPFSLFDLKIRTSFRTSGLGDTDGEYLGVFLNIQVILDQIISELLFIESPTLHTFDEGMLIVFLPDILRRIQQC